MNNKIVLKKYVNGEEIIQVFHVNDKKLEEIDDFFKSISKKKQQLKDILKEKITMNKLEQQIWDRYGNFELSHDKNNLIVENINEFVQKHSIGFAEWLGDKRFNRKTWFDETNHCMDMVTTQELFNEYIEQL